MKMRKQLLLDKFMSSFLKRIKNFYFNIKNDELK